MITYPATLPQPSTAFSGQHTSPIKRGDASKGLVEQTPRFATSRKLYSVSWKLSQAELVIFEDWYSSDLVRGVLVFGLLLPEDGAYVLQPVRFASNGYNLTHSGALHWNVSAQIESLLVSDADTNQTPPVPQWLRLSVDPTLSQAVPLAYRNASLTTRNDPGDTITLEIPPPSDDSQYIYFGINCQGDGDILITSDGVDPVTPSPFVYPEASADISDWPGTLPEVNQIFQVASNSGNVLLEFESEHTRQYNGNDTALRTYQVEWEFSLDELQDFQDFFFTTLKCGALPFNLTLPINGTFESAMVRFVSATYNETYIPIDRFKVSARLEEVLTQTVTPPALAPYPISYSPQETVTASRFVETADAGKLLVCNPDNGETITLYIEDRLIEFGVLNIGLGDVRITRDVPPWPLDFGDWPPETVNAGAYLNGATSSTSVNNVRVQWSFTVTIVGTSPYYYFWAETLGGSRSSLGAGTTTFRWSTGTWSGITPNGSAVPLTFTDGTVAKRYFFRGTSATAALATYIGEIDLVGPATGTIRHVTGETTSFQTYDIASPLALTFNRTTGGVTVT